MLPEGWTLDAAISGLAISLAVGLIVGLERGWREREEAEGQRVAGLRTFALIGLLGGAAGSLGANDAGPITAGFLAVALLGVVGYRANVRVRGSLSVTTGIAMLVTYALGAMATTGRPALALGAAVVVTVLLDQKSRLHEWLRVVQQRELGAAILLLVLTLVVLPLLPDRGFGPYDALNPYRLWVAVILVAGISFAGHVAMRFGGPHRGMLWSGLVGGVVSSTATTLALVRRAHAEPALAASAVAGSVAACGVMFVRMAAIVLVLEPPLGRALGPALSAAGATLIATAWIQSRRIAPAAAAPSPDARPFDLAIAVGFGVFLAALAIAGRTVQGELGETGVFALAAMAGFADVDAILISLSHMHATAALSTAAAAGAILLAAGANLISKAAVAWWFGSAAIAGRIVAGYALGIGALAVAGLVGLIY